MSRHAHGPWIRVASTRDRNHRRSSSVHGFDDVAAVDALQYEYVSDGRSRRGGFHSPRAGGRKGRCGPASFAGPRRGVTKCRSVDRKADGGFHFLTGPARRGADPSSLARQRVSSSIAARRSRSRSRSRGRSRGRARRTSSARRAGSRPRSSRRRPSSPRSSRSSPTRSRGTIRAARPSRHVGMRTPRPVSTPCTRNWRRSRANVRRSSSEIPREGIG
jgi:hypothetical protein